MLCTVTESREPLCLCVPPSSNPNAKTTHTQHETVNVSRSALTPKIMSLEIFHLTSLQLENAPVPTLHGHTAKDKKVAADLFFPGCFTDLQIWHTTVRSVPDPVITVAGSKLNLCC